MAYSFDTGALFENIAKMAQDFQQNMRDQTTGFYGAREKNANEFETFASPKANIYKNTHGALVFEFDMAGFMESEIALSFQGGNMLLSAARSPEDLSEKERQASAYLRHDLRFSPVENLRFPVSAEEYDQEKVRAVFKNGLLTITVPRKESGEAKNSVPIEVA